MNKKFENLLIIPDGNRRYAVEHNISPFDAYRLATKKLVEIVSWWSEDRRFDQLTLGFLTTHNFTSRPKEHLREGTKIAMELIRDVSICSDVADHNLRVKAIGDREVFFKEYEGDESELNGYLESSSHKRTLQNE